MVFHNELKLVRNLSTSVGIMPEDPLLQGNVNWQHVKVKHVRANSHRSPKLLAIPGMRSMPAECLEQCKSGPRVLLASLEVPRLEKSREEKGPS